MFTIDGGALACSNPVRYPREVILALDDLLHGLGRRASLIAPVGLEESLPSFVALDVIVAPGPRGAAWSQAVLPWLTCGPLLSLGGSGPIALACQCLFVRSGSVVAQQGGRAADLLRRGLWSALARRGGRLAASSSVERRQVAQAAGIDETSIEVLPPGHEHVLRWDGRRSRLWADDLPRRPFVLLPGSPERHATVRSLRSFAPALQRAGIDVAVVGGGAGVFADIAALQASNVRWLGRLADHELSATLEAALCLALLSPAPRDVMSALEAMALGCPVVATTDAGLAEVCGDAALLTAPNTPADWLGRVTQLATTPGLRTAMGERGRLQAASYSWRRTAQGYLDIIDRLARGPAPVTGR